METVALEMAPFFGPALARASGVNTVLMYPMLEIDGSTMAAKPIPYSRPSPRAASRLACSRANLDSPIPIASAAG